MDNQHNSSPTPRYETRDANTGGILNFLVILAVVLVVSGLICWGMFKIFTARAIDQPATDSPFADTRPLPLGPQLQVNPREDWLKFRQDQEESLQGYSWENRTAGTVKVPIDLAMQLLVKKGLPVQNSLQAPPADEKKSMPEGSNKK